MSRLREASATFARTAAHPLLSVERLFAIERVAAALEARRMGSASAWSDLVEHAVDKGVVGLPPADVRRLLAGMWRDRSITRLADAVVERALALQRRSTDRALIESYLRDYPLDHIGFGRLREAATTAADRHDWAWRDAGRRWRLWDGPAALAETLRKADDPAAVLREAGFVGQLADGAFVSAARADAGRSVR